MISNEPLDRISSHVEKLRSTTRRGFRLAHWRMITRLAQEEYDKEIGEMELSKAERVVREA